MRLEKNEFMLVVDSTNGLMLTDGMRIKDQIFADVVDSISLDHLDDKWDVKSETIINKMRDADEDEYKQLWKQIKDFWDKNYRASDGK